MTRKTKSPTRKLLFISAAFIGALILGGFRARYMGWIGGGDDAFEVETAKATKRNITQIVSASGKIQPEVEVVMRPEVSGEIIELPVKEGDYVAKGDLLVRIKPDIVIGSYRTLSRDLSDGDNINMNNRKFTSR